MLGNIGSKLKNRKHLFLFVLVLIPLLWIGFTLPNSSNHDVEGLQKAFSERIAETNSFADQLTQQWKSSSRDQFDRFCMVSGNGLFVHVFRNDSLVYWNSNELPINRFAELHFPVSGINQLENGWYYTVIRKTKNIVLAVSFGIQHKYPYLNEHLQNTFFEPFGDEHFNVDVESTNPVLKDLEGNTLVGLSVNDNVEQHETPLVIIFCLLLLELIIAWHYFMYKFLGSRGRIFLAFALASLPFLMLYFEPFRWLEGTSLLDSGILAIGDWIPNLASLICWSLTFALVGVTVSPLLLSKVGTTFSVMVSLLLIPAAVVFLPFLASEIIENSSLSLQLTNIFQLDVYSYVLLVLIAVAGWWFVQMSYFSFKSVIKWKNSKRVLLLSALIITLLSCGLAWIVGRETLSLIYWPLLVYYSIGWLVGWKDGVWSFGYILFVLLIFSTATTLNIDQLSTIKEREVREVYAKNLATEQDINTEIEFSGLKSQIIYEPYCKRFFDTLYSPSPREVKEAFEHRFFNGYWEQYDLECYYFRPTDLDTRMGEYTQRELNHLIGSHGTKSEIDPDLYIIEDDQSQYVYCFKLKIFNADSTEQVNLYGGLKSKRIPEEIGFPRLLISDKTNVFEALSGYSIAKYLNNRLIRNEGEAEYPRDIRSLTRWNGLGIHWVDNDDLSHVIYKSSNHNALVLSKTKTDFIDSVTAISFLVIANGFLFLIFRIVISGSIGKTFELSSLATRIQLVMIGLVVLSLIGFSLGSGTFIQKQYDHNSKDIIRQKLRSLHLEALNKRSLFSGQTETGNKRQELEDQLISWSRTYQTDINFYEPDGFLVASSRQKLYNIGLLGEEMQPEAIRAMKYEGRSETILKEDIGSLGFYSAYIPLNDSKGTLLGYINVQHFAQQGEFENQLQSFFVAILNVVMLLLVLSVVGAVFVSGWITKPLRMIRRSVSNVSFGQHNEQINYASNDEIGALVAEYNKKLTELDEAALKLAQSEREVAWREMAKQVAHEIKNPLTPMKLSVQHLQRAYNPGDPNNEERIQKVSAALIEQIDALTTIANAFSNFAKMPQPIMSEVDLIEVLKNVIGLFEHNSDSKVSLDTSLNKLIIDADKEMLVRVFNNIIANGIQAVPIGTTAQISVSLQVNGKNVLVRIKDNGSGISFEQPNTIFEPYFTTKTTGTGLGLAMVKQIVEGHNGTISVESTNSNGTVILVTLPVR